MRERIRNKNMSRLFISSLFFLSVFFAVSFQILPVDSATSCPGGTVKAGVCFPKGTGLSDTSVEILVRNLMNWLLAIFGFIAIIAFIISGIQYLVSAGDEEVLKTAKGNMKASIIGVIVVASGFVIVRAVDQALSGSGFFF